MAMYNVEIHLILGVEYCTGITISLLAFEEQEGTETRPLQGKGIDVQRAVMSVVLRGVYPVLDKVGPSLTCLRTLSLMMLRWPYATASRMAGSNCSNVALSFIIQFHIVLLSVCVAPPPFICFLYSLMTRIASSSVCTMAIVLRLLYILIFIMLLNNGAPPCDGAQGF